jgi:hypothetical protein
MCVTIIIAGRLLTLDLRFRVYVLYVYVSSAAADSLSYEWLIISSSWGARLSSCCRNQMIDMPICRYDADDIIIEC